MRSSLLLAAFLPLCGEPPTPEATVIVLDRSTSSICDEGTIRAALEAFMAQRPAPGSTLTVIATGCDLADATEVYALTVPASWGPGVARRQKAWQAQEEARLTTLRLPDRKPCSAIAAAIWKTAGRLRERKGVARRLVIVSDLREVSRDLRVNFERRVPTPPAFVAALKRAGLVADLAGINLTVCGVHANAAPNTPRWTARHAAALHAAWSAAFTAMNAPGVALRERCPWDEPAGGPIAGMP